MRDFSNLVVPKIIGELMQYQFNDLYKVLCNNPKAIDNGNFGLLALILSALKYNTGTGKVFILLVN